MRRGRRWVIRFLQVSTDEVYGSLSGRARACEDWPLHPSSAYSAKPPPTCCLAAHCTHGQDVVITRCTNNYARTPRKLIPLMITNALHDLPLPLMATDCNEETGSTSKTTSRRPGRT